ncbi:organic cation transporter protein-like [Frankliniella occidentalis]|uniref:Organic cation transporter protein-like n=1 Tax=Frankliniella occidentalis TaxID=133901 RepID=A0A9C6U265_FRAOC|nr:organic cation transporter protein-like [Frankliniella occidentalis]
MASALDTLIRLFGSRTLSLRFANCCYCWMANCFVYFGLLLNTVTLSGDQYVNFILSGLLEVPANLLVLWLQDYAGRRWPVAGALVVSGVCCLAVLGVPADQPVLSVALYMLGRFAVTISFNVIYVISAEMFPTNIRSSMLNICSSFGTVGLVLAPQTPLLATVSESLPLTLFGVVSLSSGLLALLFPETTGRPLPETLDEAESLGAAVDRAAQRPGGGATGSRPRARKNTSMYERLS